MIAVFDIDGTLTGSQPVDNECFSAAFESFGIRDLDTDWSRYPHTTERSLTTEILRRAGYKADESEIARHREMFVATLRERAGEIVEIAGARAFLDALTARGWRVVLATGAWSHSARVKLRAAGFRDDFPMACCDRATTREEIVLEAISMADGEPPVVLFGDAPWDVRTAASVHLPIIGVGPNAIGADARIDDYRDAERVFEVMATVASRGASASPAKRKR